MSHYRFLFIFIFILNYTGEYSDFHKFTFSLIIGSAEMCFPKVTFKGLNILNCNNSKIQYKLSS